MNPPPYWSESLRNETAPSFFSKTLLQADEAVDQAPSNSNAFADAPRPSQPNADRPSASTFFTAVLPASSTILNAESKPRLLNRLCRYGKSLSHRSTTGCRAVKRLH